MTVKSGWFGGASIAAISHDSIPGHRVDQAFGGHPADTADTGLLRAWVVGSVAGISDSDTNTPPGL